MSGNRFFIRNPSVFLMAQALYAASRKLLRDFGEIQSLIPSTFGTGRFTETAARIVRDLVIEELFKARSANNLICSDGHAIEGSCDYTWYLNPLEGAQNYGRSLHDFAMVICLVKGDVTQSALIYAPAYDEMFFAEPGAGVFMNQARLRMRHGQPRKDLMIATDRQYAGMDCRISGSTALDVAFTAAGRFDAAVYTPDPQNITARAADLMIREAGGLLKTREDGRILAAGPAVINTLTL